MINVVILAAGQGKRMRSSLPKVLQPLAGMPMLGHVLASVKKLESVSRTVVVVGCGAETVKSAFAQEEGLRFVLQSRRWEPVTHCSVRCPNLTPKLNTPGVVGRCAARTARND